MAQSIYTPLDRSAKTIRLINILPGEDVPIACTIHTYDRERCPPFVALSYTWGPSTPMVKITVDGKPFPVRTNLCSALHYIRRHDFDKVVLANRLFWIDAISIDQSNTMERNHQVNLMREIYSQASFVLTWLGPHTKLTHHGLGAVRKVSNLRHHSAASSLGSILTLDATTALEELFYNPHWTRVWIVQEVMLAKDVVIMCGNVIFEWEDIAAFFRQIRQVSLSGILWCQMNSMSMSPANKVFLNRDRDRTRFPCHGNPSLADLLIEWPDQKCEDPRDSVFGLLGLLNQRSAFMIVADYGLSTFDIFVRVLAHVDFFRFNPAMFRHCIRSQSRLLCKEP